MTSVLVHYQELALKGRNRPWFVDRLVRNLRTGTAGLGVVEVRPLMGRIELVLAAAADVHAIRRQIGRTFGIANFAVASRVAPDLEQIAATALQLTEGLTPESFRVAATRADKRFPFTSPQIEREVGGRLKLARGWRVDLDRPALVVRVEMVPGAAFCYAGRDAGPGGLPTGVSGRAACLLSGGIDSPVAALRIIKRGCRAVFVHFHAYPIVTKASQEKARQLVRVLTDYQQQSRLFLVPFGEIQRRIVAATPAPLRTVLYRRFMLRIADRIAHRSGARVLVTGEVVGQVASQTLDNLAAIEAVTAMPVLRPVVGMDKEEITAEARRIGTYEISILPDEDCCQVFTPRHPTTSASLANLEAAEQALEVEPLVAAALDATVHEDFRLSRTMTELGA